MSDSIKFGGDVSCFGNEYFTFMSNPLPGAASPDYLVFPDTWENEPKIGNPWRMSDEVNSPSHYTRGKQEAIDIIEEAIGDAPDPKSGMLQAQVLKYLLRLWLKDNPEQDARKAQWYLNRLVDSLN